MDPYERGYGDVSRVAEQRIVLRGGFDVTEDIHRYRQMSEEQKFPVGGAKDAALADGLPAFTSSFVPISPDNTLTPITVSMAGMTRREKMRCVGIINQTGDGTPGNIPSFAIHGSVVPAKKTSKVAFYDGDVVLAGPPSTFMGEDGQQYGTGFANGRDGISNKFIGPSMYVLRHGSITERFQAMEERITQLVRDTLRTKMGGRGGDWDHGGGAGALAGLDERVGGYVHPFVPGKAVRSFNSLYRALVGNVTAFVGGQTEVGDARSLMLRYFYPDEHARNAGVAIGRPAAAALGLERRTAFLGAVARIAEEFDPVEAGFWNPMTRVAFLLAASWNAGNYLWAALPSDGDPPPGVPPIEEPQIQMAIRAAWDFTVADSVVAPFVAHQDNRRMQLEQLTHRNPMDTGMFAPMLLALMEEERHRINSMLIGTNLGVSPAGKMEWDCLVGIGQN